jgi:hypothetical protein
LEFRHTPTYPGNFDVYCDDEHYMNVHVDHYKLKGRRRKFYQEATILNGVLWNISWTT